MQRREIKVWDPLIRIFHWVLVAGFGTAYLTEGSKTHGVHVYAGYLIGGLIAFRLLWGLVGSKYARFADFVHPPRQVIAYAKSLLTKQPQHYLGHNPAGGAMVIALLISLGFTVVTGLAGYGAEGSGPLGAWLWRLGVGAEEALEDVHGFFADLTLALIGFHVAGVLASSWLHKENLVRAMVTGCKQDKS